MSAAGLPACWLAVASADHVARGRAGGFMQVCHGKGGPLRRLKPGDGVIYYSPSRVMGVKDGYQSFTAIGAVTSGAPYRADMGHGFTPFRRDVIWQASIPAPISAFAGRLDLTAARNWGYALRFGLLPLSLADFRTIQNTMQENTMQEMPQIDRI